MRCNCAINSCDKACLSAAEDMRRWGPLFVLGKLTWRLQRALTQQLPSNSREDAPAGLFSSGLLLAAGGNLRKAFDAALPLPGES
jgi:hypothetical protein